jgi:hypothetical protein
VAPPLSVSLLLQHSYLIHLKFQSCRRGKANPTQVFWPRQYWWFRQKHSISYIIWIFGNCRTNNFNRMYIFITKDCRDRRARKIALQISYPKTHGPKIALQIDSWSQNSILVEAQFSSFYVNWNRFYSKSMLFVNFAPLKSGNFEVLCFCPLPWVLGDCNIL